MHSQARVRRAARRLDYWRRCAVLAVFCFSQQAAAAIALVQSNWSTPNGSQTTTTVTFDSAQTAGNLNVVIVSWNDPTSTLVSITDTQGNTYSKAIGPTLSAGHETQYIYYAKNILAAAAGANTVSVVASTAVPYPDIRIAEYSGIDTVNPLDGAIGAAGVGSLMDSGLMTTTNANDLLVAGNELEFATTDVGPGYTERLFTNDSSMLMDQVVTSTGSYNATATQDSGWWVMQLAAFKAATGGGDTQAPTAPTNLSTTVMSSTQINLSWTASTDNVGVTGYRVERCQDAGCSNFESVGTPTGTTFSNTGLNASTTYRYQVFALDAANNVSAASTMVSATTQASLDTDPPTTPGTASATAASSTQITVSWGISTDHVGVTQYLIERCQGLACLSFTQIATTTNLSYSNTALTPATNYAYRIRATDAAGNFSPYSNTVTAATPYAGPVTFSYGYDSLGRVIQVTGSDGSAIDYQYDSNGNVTTINRQ